MGREIDVDCLHDPLGTVDSFFNSAIGKVSGVTELARWDWGVRNFFEKFLQEEGVYKQVPEINSTSLSAIPSNTLVRYRGMVQDMFENEFYVGCYKNGDNLRTTKYTDSVSPNFCTIRRDSLELWERRILYCVPVPGENQWVKEAFACTSWAQNASGSRTSSSKSSNAEKRQRDDEEASTDIDVEMDSASCSESCDVKRRREETTTNWGEEMKSGLDLNFPLGESTFEAAPLRSCIVKVYDNDDAEIMLNDVVEFFGILTFDPELSTISFNKSEADFDPFMEADLCSRFPQSQVPRLHCVTLRKLVPSRMISNLPDQQHKQIQILTTPGAVTNLRNTIISGFTNLLKGDSLAAEYLLLHLLSQIHKRVDNIVLGNLSLNITLGAHSGNSSLPKDISQLVGDILPCSHFLPLSCESLNKSSWAPRKDYDENRLVTGVLQLPAGTHLTLDLTSMNEGMLNSIGVQNMCTLKKMMQFQTVSYDFKFHPIEISTDISVLVTSNSIAETRNFLPTDICVPLVPYANSSSSFEEKDLATLRLYFSAVRSLDYNQGTNLNQVLENDLVQVMQQDRSIDVETFHRWLTLSRLQTVSHGETQLKIEHWKKVLDLERLRKLRIAC